MATEVEVDLSATFRPEAAVSEEAALVDLAAEALAAAERVDRGETSTLFSANCTYPFELALTPFYNYNP